ncbi:MAG: choice-of-anchor Q domain-containing protein [Pedobacter sp.]|nr:choice-of-anchor Q domain-containing protein [Pedobacter sp.]
MIKGKYMLRSGLACALLLLGNVAMGAGATIKVTTDQDENGSGSACSLREALHVINSKSKAAWGGCPDAAAVGDNIIQLEALTYRLTAGELQVLEDVIIQGADTIVAEDDPATPGVDDTLNPYTGLAPNRKRPLTVIDAEDHSRIINSFGATGSSLSLKDLELRRGSAPFLSNQGNGGAIYAALSLTLDNVVIRDSEAIGELDGTVPVGGMGGAIFLSLNNISLSATDTTFRNNDAFSAGGAIAMVCTQDLSLASHTVSLTRSLLAENSSLHGGAGAIEACGITTLDITASTLAKNTSKPMPQRQPTPPAPAVADEPRSAITYRQTVSAQGSVSITNVTAAEQLGGSVFAFKALASVSLNNSVLIGNTGNNCDLDTALSFPSGNYNSIDDASCNALLLSSGDANIPGGAFSDELLPLAFRGGLTEIYLPNKDSLTVLNVGPSGDNCTGTDQRGLSRKNGSNCDLGAAERMEPTAVDDEAKNGTDSRVVVVDVLANDSFGEDDSGPLHYASPAVTVMGTSPGVSCTWSDASAEKEERRNKLLIDNHGVITPESSPASCTYQLNVVGVDPATHPAMTATVTATISNIAPVAVNDIYVRPIGVTQIALNLLANDTDADDSTPFNQPTHLYPIYITTKPVLGDLVGETGLCPGSSYTSGSPKFCYARNLTYIAKNPQSPFTDYIQYSVYDDDGSASNTATVTIKTNAPDPDKGETGGSLDLAGGLLLALLGLRRARKL